MAPECTSTPIKKGHDAASGMVVVANRLPFVLKRDEDGILHRKARYFTVKSSMSPKKFHVKIRKICKIVKIIFAQKSRQIAKASKLCRP